MMLEVSALPSPSKLDHCAFIADHVGFPTSPDDFMVDDSLLDYIDFSTCDVPSLIFDADGDILPDLEVTDLIAEFSDDDIGTGTTACDDEAQQGQGDGADGEAKPEPPPEEKKDVRRRNGEEGSSAVTTEDSSSAAPAAGCSDDANKSSAAEGGQGHSKKKAAGNNNNSSSSSHGKRKVKVDWTPELHRRFVQAVEQLGIDKAVPSRILEIMGIQCLTRHNIASHLQKYRSHRKHLMAREAEAATWAQAQAHKRQAAAAPPRTTNDSPSPWLVPLPTIGFPPPPPLHVWGHAAEAQPPPPPPMLPVWPRHLPPPRPWSPAPPAYWHHHHHQYNVRKWGPHTVTQGTPCVPPMPAAAMLPRFPAPPHPAMYRPPVVIPPQSISKLAGLQLQLDNAHPSKESIDAAIGDVLVKPWLPLPLGLKPPSLDSVMSELHKQGIPKVPPAAASPATTSRRRHA